MRTFLCPFPQPSDCCDALQGPGAQKERAFLFCDKIACCAICSSVCLDLDQAVVLPCVYYYALNMAHIVSYARFVDDGDVVALAAKNPR